MSGRIDPAVWAERQEWIRKQLDSGFSVARFCREHGLHEGNFHAWKLKLSKDSQAADANRNGKVQRPDHSGLAFVQLPRPVASSPNASNAWVEISKADGLIVRVPASNLIALQLVLSALRPVTEEARDA